jgi:hypothetical protein
LVFCVLACGSAKTKCAYLRVGFFGMKHNVLALGAVADFEAQNCQYTTKVDER